MIPPRNGQKIYRKSDRNIDEHWETPALRNLETIIRKRETFSPGYEKVQLLLAIWHIIYLSLSLHCKNTKLPVGQAAFYGPWSRPNWNGWKGVTSLWHKMALQSLFLHTCRKNWWVCDNLTLVKAAKWFAYSPDGLLQRHLSPVLRLAMPDNDWYDNETIKEVDCVVLIKSTF